MRHDKIGRHLRVEMMVEKNSWRFVRQQQFFHVAHTVGAVEIEATDEVGLFEKRLGLFLVLVVSDHLVGTGKPLQEIGHGIGYNDSRFLSTPSQEIGPSQARANGIAIRAFVTTHHHLVSIVEHRLQQAQLLLI